MIKATRAGTKKHNSRLVFKTIYHAGRISRAEIARQTGLTRPTVSSLAAELMTEGLVEDTGQGASAGGRRPTLLAVQADGYHLLCLELSSHRFRGARLDLHGHILAEAAVPTAGRRGMAALDLVRQLVTEMGGRGGRPLLGIGVATPGRVDGRRGLVEESVNLGWRDLPLRELLQAHLDVPVYLANNSHAAALGAYLYGTGRSTRNLILIKIGQGIGAGIVLDGQVLQGDGLAAGEIGHFVVDPDGAQCSCGNHGCLETIASASAMLAAAAHNPGSAPAGMSDLDWPAFVAAYHAGDPAALAAVAAAARALGTVIGFMITAFDSQHLLLSGPVADLGPRFLAAVRAAAAVRALPGMVAAANITYAALDPNSMLLGSAALILRRELGLD